MGHPEITVQIDLKPTVAESGGELLFLNDGRCRLILQDARDSIDVMEQGLLNTVYPAMRGALAKGWSRRGIAKLLRCSVNHYMLLTPSGFFRHFAQKNSRPPHFWLKNHQKGQRFSKNPSQFWQIRSSRIFGGGLWKNTSIDRHTKPQ